MPAIVHYQRKRSSHGHYSLELIFQEIRAELRDLEIADCIAPKVSKGIADRAAIVLHAARVPCRVFHVTGDINFAAILVPRRKVVLTILDCGFLHRSRGLRRSLFKLLWLTLPIRRALIVTTISECVKQEICSVLGKNLAIEVVYPTISSEFRHAPKVFSTDRPRILLIGSAPNKNLKRILEACSALRCDIHLVGSPDKETLSGFSHPGGQLELSSKLSPAEVLDAYDRCDLLVFASTYEGFGMPIVEAQTVGRCVVTSNIAPLTEVAGQAAVFVNPFSVESIRDGVQRVISDGELRKKLIAEGLINAKRFSLENSAAKYRRIYESVLRKSEPSLVTDTQLQ